MTKRTGKKSKHDHRQSTWLICGGHIIWCYRCGAWRQNVAGRQEWHRPTGLRGENPAMARISRQR